MAIKKETRLQVADNSGAKEVLCIHIVGSTGKDTARVGDIIRCSVKAAIPGGTAQKGKVVTGIIVRTCKETRRSDGSMIRFGDNAVALIKSPEDTTPLGTRIFGPVAREVRAVSPKIASLAPEVL
jgi:large subunit ribosomal protein L14